MPPAVTRERLSGRGPNLFLETIHLFGDVLSIYQQLLLGVQSDSKALLALHALILNVGYFVNSFVSVSTLQQPPFIGDKSDDRRT